MQSREPMEDDASVLAVIIDAGPSWAKYETDTLSAVIEQLIIFLNAYQLLSATNQLTVLATHPAAVEVLWPPPSTRTQGVVAAPSDAHGLRAAVTAGISRVLALSYTPSADSNDEPLLSAAMVAAMCRLNREMHAQPRVQPRMLVLHASPDSPSQHLATMNAVFAAQKLRVLIDTVLLHANEDSMLLQQAAFLTGGLYLRAAPNTPMQRALAQYLITHCLPDRCARQFVSAPPQGELETRALCFLTRQPLEIGFACSVCLAVFSSEKPSCPVCGSRFALPPKRPRKPAVASAPGATNTILPAASITVPPPPEAAEGMAPWQLAPAGNTPNS